jgi:signal transduction histidine kinase
MICRFDKEIACMIRQVSFLQVRVLVVALCLVTFVVGLLIISTTASAQDNSTDNQSEITIVERTIVPANTTTIKANVTVIPINNNTAAR